MNGKKCRKCGKTKRAFDFRPSTPTGGKHTLCKQCIEELAEERIVLAKKNEKRCTKCLAIKDIGDFYGSRSWCKKCINKQNNDNYKPKIASPKGWVVVYDPENCFAGKFGVDQFETTLASGNWPYNSIWYCQEERRYYQVRGDKTYTLSSVAAKKRIAKMRQDKWAANEG